MKYKYGCQVAIPYIEPAIDPETGDAVELTKGAVLKLRGTGIDRRRVKRTVRQWVWHNLGRRIHSEELTVLCKSSRVWAFNEDGSFTDFRGRKYSA